MSTGSTDPSAIVYAGARTPRDNSDE